MKIVHTSDLHLGRFYRGDLPLEIAKIRREELWKTFENLIDYIRFNSIDILIIAGDLYERDYFSKSDFERLYGIFRKLENTKIFVIGGNHDYFSEISPLINFDLPNFYIINNENYIELKDYRLRIYGKSWDREFDYSSSLNYHLDKSFKNIILLHGTVNGKSYFPIDLNNLERIGFDYVALGHIHKNEKISDNIFYSGALEPLSFKDTGIHGFNLITIDNENIDVEVVSFAKREYKTFEIFIDSTDSLEKIAAKVSDILIGNKENLNRIILKGNYEDTLYLIEYLEYKKEGFYVEFIDNLETVYDLKFLKESNKNNILSLIIDELKDNKEALNHAIKALMEARYEDN